MASGSNLIACGAQGGLYFSPDCGISWRTQLPPVRPTQGWRSFTGLAVRGGYAVAVGFSGVLYISGDSGHSWEAFRTDRKPNFLSVEFLGESCILATTDDGMIYLIQLP
jgi:photosystem II stability/assembly factor-like uncharacterized protein